MRRDQEHGARPQHSEQRSFVGRLRRRGFSLLEVMIALGILTVSLVILVQSQSEAVAMTQEAERFIAATDLARLKMAEAMLRLEEEGFQNSEVVEFGEFDDLGDEITNLEFGKEYEDFHWEYTITEIDIQLAGDLMSMASEMEGDGDGGLGGMLGGAGIPGDAGGAGGAGDAAGMLGNFMQPQMLTEMVGPYIRMVVVRVWWGEGSEEATEEGTEITLAAHVANPAGMLNAGSSGALPGGLPGGTP